MLSVVSGTHFDSSLLNEFTLLDFTVPEGSNGLFFIFLADSHGHGHFTEGKLTHFVTISHKLSSLDTFERLLELEEGNGGGKAQSLRGFIGLIREIPDVDTILLCNEDHTRSGGRESSTSVVGGLGVFRPKDRFFHFFKRSFPKAEMEVMDSQEHIIVEGRAFQSQARPIITLCIKVSADKLVFSLVLISSLSRSRSFSLSPVNED